MDRLGTILRPDDFSVGQFVTALNGADLAISYIIDGDGEAVSTQRAIDHSLEGVALTILAVELPYVVVAYMSGRGRRVVDVRETDLMKISAAYVEALLPQVGTVTAQCPCPVCVARRSVADECGGK